MIKQNVRIAQVKAYVIKKRCRKEQFEIVDAVCTSDESAIKKLKENLEQAKQDWKSFRLFEPIVYNAVRMQYDTHSTLQRPLMPNASDNVRTFELVA